MFRSTVRYKEAGAKLQLIARNFAGRLEYDRKKLFGGVRLHLKEHHWVSHSWNESEHLINLNHYRDTIVCTISLSRSRAFGIGRKEFCKLLLILACHIEGAITSRTLKILGWLLEKWRWTSSLE